MLKCSPAIVGLLILGSANSFAASINRFVQTNLVSDLPGVAAHQDSNLVNPWGIAAGPTSPFWVSDNGTGVSTLYNGSGTALPLVVTIPPAPGSSGPTAPTGIVFNATSGFGGAHFIFDTEDGTISSWASGTAAVFQNSGAAGSVYKGLAMGSTASGDLLYAANFSLGKIDVFDSSFHPTTVAGGFTDPNLPAGYAPFDVQNIGGQLYVTYALQDAAKKDDVAGPGHGFVDVFDTDGHLVRRLVSNGALNSPWGLTVAPNGFGPFGGDLLVGNFGDGRINAYNSSTGAFVGTLDDTNGSPLTIQGLWGLSFGNGSFGQNASFLYFTAGIPGGDNVEDHGLFGSISASVAPEPSSLGLMVLAAFALGVPAVRIRAGKRQIESGSDRSLR